MEFYLFKSLLRPIMRQDKCVKQAPDPFFVDESEQPKLKVILSLNSNLFTKLRNLPTRSKIPLYGFAVLKRTRNCWFRCCQNND